MVKKIISVATAFLMLCCMIPFAAFADDVLDICPKCGERTYEAWTDFSTEVPDLGFPLSAKRRICRSCGYAYYDWNCLGFTGYKEFDNSSGSFFIDYIKDWKNKTLGKNATAEKIDSTNGGANIPAAGGRNPKGFGDVGKANVNFNGKNVLWVEPFGVTSVYGSQDNGAFSTIAPTRLCAGSSSSGSSYNIGYSAVSYEHIAPVYYFTAPVSGLYYIGVDGSPYDLGTFDSFQSDKWVRNDYIWKFSNTYSSSISLNKGESAYLTFNALLNGAGHNPYKFFLNNIPVFIEPLGDSGITNYNKITINNNTWNGNIYQDNSTNLTYIYPQYTTVNEKNETVTNISNTPIIYNNETYQYYTYDQTTKNYYYITYPNQPTPPPTATPSPTPDPSLTPILPDEQLYVIPQMSGNSLINSHGTWIASGSTKYSDQYDYYKAFDRSTSTGWCMGSGTGGKGGRELPCYVQIDIPDPQNYYINGYVIRGHKADEYPSAWILQASADGTNWEDLDTQSDQDLSDFNEHSYSLDLHKAYKYYRVMVTAYPNNYMGIGCFNLLGYDAKDVVMPTPSPSPTPAPTDPPSPSPAPDPGKPDSGDKTNNFWTIIFPNGGGSEDGKKGIFWALVSLILALIAFFANLAVGVGYLFPFLPDGVVMTINTCLIVIFLFTIIKFIMRSK